MINKSASLISLAKVQNMKTTKLIFAVSVACLSINVANAFFVPYNGNNIGTATFKSNGACAMPTKVFQNARIGQIYNTEGGSSIGLFGIVDSLGNIIATGTDALKSSTCKTEISTNYTKCKTLQLVDFASAETESFIEAQSGCSIRLMIPLTSSKMAQDYIFVGSPNDRDTIKMQAKFTGYTNWEYTTSTTSKTITEKYTGEKFSASVTFLTDSD